MSSQSPKSGPLRPILWVLGALVALIAIAWIALAVLFPPAKVRAIVSAQLSGALSREVRFADASVSLWPPVRLSVRGPALAEPGGFSEGAAFRARSIHLDLDPFALFGGRLAVRRLVLDGPQVHLLLRADGSSNFDNLAKAPPPGAKPSRPMDLEIRELSIRDGRVLVDDLKAQRRTLLGIGTRLAFSSTRGGTRLTTSGTTLLDSLAFGPIAAARSSDLNQSLAKLKWRIEHRGAFDTARKRLALERLALKLGGAELALSGVVDDPGPHARVDLKARGSGVELGEVLGYLAAADAKAVHGIRGAGKIEFDLGARGAVGAARLPDVTGVLRVRDGSFHYPGAPAGVEALGFTARFAPDSMGIGDLAARVSGQPVRATLAVTRFADPLVRFSVVGDVDLAAVAPMVAPKDTKLAGRVAVDVRGSGRAKDPGGMALDGRAKLAQVSVQSPQLPNRVEDVNGEIAFSPARAAVRSLTAKAGKSSFTLDATVTRPLALLAPVPGSPGAPREPVPPAGVDFSLVSPYLDLAELLPVTPGAPVLPNATGGGKVRIGRLKNQKLDVSDVAATVGLDPAVLTVPDFSLKGYGGAASGNARFDLHDPATPGFAVKAKLDTLQADALLSAWTPAKNLLHGAISTNLDLSGAGSQPDQLKRTLTAVGLAAINNGTLGPGPTLQALADFVKIPALKEVRFNDLKLPLRVERGRVVTDPVVLNGSHGEWKLAGAVGFDGALDYAVSITLPPEVSAALGARSALAAGALADDQGRMLLDLHVGGTAKAPRVAWDTKAMRDRLAGRASEALLQQRAKLEEEARAALQARQNAAADSARKAAEAYRKAVEDSLRKKGRDLLKGFFGGARDTSARDTTK